jgi:hypothetical protein
MTPLSNRLKIAGLLLLTLLAVALVYTTLHESGHALAGLAFGGRVSDFNVNFFNLDAHVNIDGTFTAAQDAVINVSGAALPLLAWLILILFLPKKGSLLLQGTKTIASIATLFSLLAWVILPFLYLKGAAPAGDDVTKFITTSGLPPLAVAFGALALFAVGWILFALRFGDLRGIFRTLLPSEGKPVPAWRWAASAGIMLAALIGGIWLMISTLNRDPYAPPKGYVLAATVDLSSGDFQSETIVSFSLSEPGEVAIFLRSTGINTPYIDLALVPPQGEPTQLVHGEELSSDATSGQYQYALSVGEYNVVLTGRKGHGVLKVYLRLP